MKNSTGTAIQSLQTISSQLSPEGSIAQRLGPDGLLGTLSAQLSGEGYLGLALAPTGGKILSSWLSTISSQLSPEGSIAQRLGPDGTLSQRLSSVIDGLDSTASRIIDALGNVAITFPDSISATLSGDATISAVTDVAGAAAQTASLYDSLVGEVDADGLRSQLDGLVGVLRTSFPFGCIFVLIDVCDALSAAPIAPVFSADLPAVVGTYHAEIDLSFFDSVATLWRGGLVVVYVAGLYSATKQWVFNGGGESA